MTSELYSLLTPRASAFLCDAVQTLQRDSYVPHLRESHLDLAPVTIALEWIAHNNTKLWQAINKGEKRQKEHLSRVEAKCLHIMREVLTQRGRNPYVVTPLGWDHYFPDNPFSDSALSNPEMPYDTLSRGTLANALQWNAHNRYKLELHSATICLCKNIILDIGQMKHLESKLETAYFWVNSKKQTLENSQFKLLFLQGDLQEIQNERERILQELLSSNIDTSHFYSPLNNSGLGYTQDEKTFKHDIRSHVERGVNTDATRSLDIIDDLGIGF